MTNNFWVLGNIFKFFLVWPSAHIGVLISNETIPDSLLPNITSVILPLLPNITTTTGGDGKGIIPFGSGNGSGGGGDGNMLPNTTDFPTKIWPSWPPRRRPISPLPLPPPAPPTSPVTPSSPRQPIQPPPPPPPNLPPPIPTTPKWPTIFPTPLPPPSFPPATSPPLPPFPTSPPSMMPSLNIPFCDFLRVRRAAVANDDEATFRHGYIISPPTRALLCQRRINKRCGAVTYEPQSVEGRKGFPVYGPRDRHIAGAERFHELDEYGVGRWVHVDITDNLCRESNDTYRLNIRWQYTSAHASDAYHLYATDSQYNPAVEPLTRAHLRFVQTVRPVNRNRQALHVINFNIPSYFFNRQGSFLVVWDIADTPNAFYQVIDYKLDIKESADPGTQCFDRERCFKYGFAKNRCNCRKFYRCWNNNCYEHVCPVNLVFDESTNQCNYRHLVRSACN